MAEKISEQFKNEMWDFYEEFRHHPALDKLYATQQHRTSNTYRHVCLVTESALKFAFKRNLHLDYHSLIRGGLLHDLFYYDWRKDRSKIKHHLTNHPQIAIENASKYFELSQKEIDIISNHMWPVTITKYPKSREAKIISLMDKKVTTEEFFMRKRNIVIFDLDGTLVNTIPDLHLAVNFALKENGFPLKDEEHTRISIGNGIRMLVKRSLPEEVDEATYVKVLDDFIRYYSKHYCDNSKPYPGVIEMLRELRKKGYRLGVTTNKTYDIAQKMIDYYYPDIFQEVVGSGPKVRYKPSYDMMNLIRNKMKVRRRRKVVYVGDSEVDYQFAKNSLVKCLLITYGYRTKRELQLKSVPCPTVDTPSDLLEMIISK